MIGAIENDDIGRFQRLLLVKSLYSLVFLPVTLVSLNRESSHKPGSAVVGCPPAEKRKKDFRLLQNKICGVSLLVRRMEACLAVQRL